MSAQPTTEEILNRILLLVPTRRDAQITSSLLSKAGLSCIVCNDITHLAREIAAGAGAILLTEEVLADQKFQEIVNAVNQQQGWSDLPVIMLMAGATESAISANALAALSNVTLIDRPAAVRSMLSAVQAALRSRHRQYQIREQLETIRTAKEERQSLLDSERAARQDAERASRVKDEFLATLSHELRTPLTAIFGWVQLMKATPGNADTTGKAVEALDRNIRIQQKLIEDLLDVSRIISGKIILDVHRLDLDEVIDAALESVMPSIKAKEIRIERDPGDPSARYVKADRARLQQVLWNLLTNAVKFTPKGGKILLSKRRMQGHVELRVTDTGEGIPPEFLPHLFERFAQANGSTTRVHGGLGLGLSIVRNLIEMHGGTVRAESQGTGKGATFTIELPVSSVEDTAVLHEENVIPPASALGPEHARRLGGIKVLVVDDDPDSREVVRRFLLQSDATPILAASAAEARSLLDSVKPDVIISDIGMPIQDGYEFIRAVRVQGLKIPAVALTAFARPEDRIRSIQAGYQMHLSKPVEPAELIAVVANLAGLRAS